MAKHLARIHGTEEDKVNCPFYFKIGACRHADRCSRLHHKPAFSPTLLIKHVFRPLASSEQEKQEEFLVFYEDFFTECSKFGNVDELHVVDNTGDHMIGHCYLKFRDEEMAADCLAVMQGRYYAGIPLQVEFSPVTEFREARCRDYDEGGCNRAGFCNFIHAKPVPGCLIRSLQEDSQVDRDAEHAKEKKRHKKRKRERKERDGGERNKSRKRSSDNDDRSDGGGGEGDSDSN